MQSGDPVLADDTPSLGGAFILPVVFGVGTWAVYEFTRSSLGDWRYVPTAVLGLGAVYFAVIGLVSILAFRVATSEEVPSPTRTRTLVGISVLLVAAALGVNLFLAVRDHSAKDAASALIVALWAVFGPGSTKLPLGRRGRLIASNAANLSLLAWILSIAVFHLH